MLSQVNVMWISELITGVVIVRAFDKQQQIMYGLNLCVEPVLCMWDDDSGTSHTKGCAVARCFLRRSLVGPAAEASTGGDPIAMRASSSPPAGRHP